MMEQFRGMEMGAEFAEAYVHQDQSPLMDLNLFYQPIPFAKCNRYRICPLCLS